mmetsp:Transcript_67175/g.190610  ORF Transcript_67175/g.190610 Transcript_67175/m.190610 type:complete len:334 (-) Transcript_67175:622-1623(-)
MGVCRRLDVRRVGGVVVLVDRGEVGGHHGLLGRLAQQHALRLVDEGVHEAEVQARQPGEQVEVEREAAAEVLHRLEDLRRRDGTEPAARQAEAGAGGAAGCGVDLRDVEVGHDVADAGEELDAVVARVAHRRGQGALAFGGEGEGEQGDRDESQVDLHHQLSGPGGRDDDGDQQPDQLDEGAQDQACRWSRTEVYIGHDIGEGVQAAIEEKVQHEARVHHDGGSADHILADKEPPLEHLLLWFRLLPPDFARVERDVQLVQEVVARHSPEDLARLFVPAVQRQVVGRLVYKEVSEDAEEECWQRPHCQEPPPVKVLHHRVVNVDQDRTVHLAD